VSRPCSEFNWLTVCPLSAVVNTSINSVTLATGCPLTNYKLVHYVVGYSCQAHRNAGLLH
jgi:hypothetical protein